MAAMARSSAFLANSNVASSRCQEAVILSSPSSLRQTTTASASAALNSKFSGCVLSLKPEQRIGAVNGRNVGVRAMAEAKPSAPEVFEVEVEKPYGLRFYKGADGGTYIDVIQPGSNAGNTGVFTVGDKVLATSAVFGNDIWPAAEYGRTMYTIRQRVGPLLMKMEKRYGTLLTKLLSFNFYFTSRARPPGTEEFLTCLWTVDCPQVSATDPTFLPLKRDKAADGGLKQGLLIPTVFPSQLSSLGLLTLILFHVIAHKTGMHVKSLIMAWYWSTVGG